MEEMTALDGKGIMILQQHRPPPPNYPYSSDPPALWLHFCLPYEADSLGSFILLRKGSTEAPVQQGTTEQHQHVAEHKH